MQNWRNYVKVVPRLNCGPDLLYYFPLSVIQAVGDHALLVFARNCPNIDQLNLGSCSRLTDHTCHSLARHCNKLRQVDISSCNNMTDNSLRALGRGCPLVSKVVFAAPRIKEDKH